MKNRIGIQYFCSFIVTISVMVGCTNSSTHLPEKSEFPVQVSKPDPDPSLGPSSEPEVDLSSYSDLAKKCYQDTLNAGSYNGENTFARTQISYLHKKGYCGNGVISAVFDNGIDFSALTLQGKYILGGGISHTYWLKGGRPSVQDAYGMESNPPEDYDSNTSFVPSLYSKSGGHGQQMAHILAGSKNSGQQLGIAPDSKLMAFAQPLNISSLVREITQAKKQGARVVNFSIQYLTLRDFTLDLDHPQFKNGEAIQDVLVVVVASNQGSSVATPMESGRKAPFETAFQNIAVVVAVDSQNKLTSSSCKCGNTQKFCIAIPSSGPTSPAAPVLSGALALLVEAFPNASAKEIMQAVFQTAIPLGNPDETGVGLLNAQAAFEKLETTYSPEKPGVNAASKKSAYIGLSQPNLSSQGPHIALGSEHSCFTNQGIAKCWGNNVSGQLGNDSVYQSNVPMTVKGLPDAVTQLSAGATHTCALLNNGEIFCWGSNFYGELGTGNQNDSFIPAKMTGLPVPATSIHAGTNYTCVLLQNGEIYCTGDNRKGQLGDGTLISRSIPQKVFGLGLPAVKIPEGSAFHSASAHMCAVLNDGSAKCWGSNKLGQLGDQKSVEENPVPVSVIFGQPIESIEAGLQSTCLLTKSGDVYCWGYNREGALGNGTQNDSLIPVQVKGFSSPVVQITSGDFGYCALTKDQSMLCWGDGRDGRLGNSLYGSSPTQKKNTLTPVEVEGSTNQILAMATSRYHGCALWKGNILKCWGNNGYGKLGTGTQTPSFVPVEVSR